MEVIIYIGLDLEDEVHSIWVTGYMDKRPSFLAKDNMHEGQHQSWRTIATKDKLAAPWILLI